LGCKAPFELKLYDKQKVIKKTGVHGYYLFRKWWGVYLRVVKK
jgi:hypothetical protein